MKLLHQVIFGLSIPYLEKGLRKDLVTHTKEVVNAMEILLRYEGGDEDLLITSAILHEIGWSKVPKEIQLNWRDKVDKIRGEKLHIEYARPIIQKILGELNYEQDQIKDVVEIVKSHKFRTPATFEQMLLIDADNMSDATKAQFYSDAIFYQATPKEIYDFRLKNKFYTPTGKIFFDREMKNRRREFSKAQNQHNFFR